MVEFVLRPSCLSELVVLRRRPPDQIYCRQDETEEEAEESLAIYQTDPIWSICSVYERKLKVQVSTNSTDYLTSDEEIS